MIKLPEIKIDHIPPPKTRGANHHIKRPLVEHARFKRFKKLSVSGVEILNAILDTRQLEITGYNPRAKVQEVIEILENLHSHLMKSEL
ncbi:MAG: hypothetical protein KAS32_04200 [Candidatus Peribacteraceae bacterium]|nr:hypothetical protein [Candidatus Peribacteraceae bacterium]